MSAGFRDRLFAGERVVGTVLSLPGAAYAELIASAFQFVWIDLEHAALSLSDMQSAVIGAQAAGCAALARVPRGESLAPYLDAGVDGIVIPRVDETVIARARVDELRYPPVGRRGYGPRRSLLRPSAAAPVCLVQIETAAGVRGCEGIAAVDGVDGVVAGAADLSYELGAPGELAAPVVLEAIASIREATLRAGKAFGVAGVASWPLDGVSMVTISSDLRLISRALHAAAAGSTTEGGAQRAD